MESVPIPGSSIRYHLFPCHQSHMWHMIERFFPAENSPSLSCDLRWCFEFEISHATLKLSTQYSDLETSRHKLGIIFEKSIKKQFLAHQFNKRTYKFRIFLTNQIISKWQKWQTSEQEFQTSDWSKIRICSFGIGRWGVK